MLQRTVAGLAVVSLVGCTTAPGPRIVSPDLYVGSMGDTTRYERERARPVELDDNGAKNKVTPALFWAGTVLGIAGAVGAISFGAAGAGAEKKLEDGFSDGLTVAEENQLRDRGDAFNSISVGSLAAALVGVGVASLVYGVDYTRCGPLAPKKRRCKETGRE